MADVSEYLPLGTERPIAWGQNRMPAPETQEVFYKPGDGFRGIWYGCTPLNTEYCFKYSGGLGTYCAKHRSLAVYCPKVNRTYFVWGGTTRDYHLREFVIRPGGNQADGTLFGENQLLHMISYYDHETGMLKRPVIIFDKWCGDPHDNPVMTVDKKGYVWVFSPSHGPWTTPSYIFRSVRPYEIDSFERIATTLFAYPQPWVMPGGGIVLMHTVYDGGRRLAASFSADGRSWSKSNIIAQIEQGQYQVSNASEGVIYTAFNYHPDQGGLEARTNLYVMKSDDFGRTWKTINNTPLKLPLTRQDNPALVCDYEKQGLLVYMKDLTFDNKGNPVVLYVTSKGFESGPKNDPRTWTLAGWTGGKWRFSSITTSDSNYDMGSLYIQPGGEWRLIAPTITGPQPYNPGGEMAVHISHDAGETWNLERQLTHNSPRNHTYARRPVNANVDFLAFWADGHGRKPSQSRLYFANAKGEVFCMPEVTTEEFVKPEKLASVRDS